MTNKIPNYAVIFSIEKFIKPFLKCNLPGVLSLTTKDLLKMNKKLYHPLFFSLKMVGIPKTIVGLYDQLKKH